MEEVTIMKINVLKKGDRVINVTPEFIAVQRKNGEVDIIPLIRDGTGLRVDIENIVTIGYRQRQTILLLLHFRRDDNGRQKGQISDCSNIRIDKQSSGTAFKRYYDIKAKVCSMQQGHNCSRIYIKRRFFITKRQ